MKVIIQLASSTRCNAYIINNFYKWTELELSALFLGVSQPATIDHSITPTCNWQCVSYSVTAHQIEMLFKTPLSNE